LQRRNNFSTHPGRTGASPAKDRCIVTMPPPSALQTTP
jgi:hypothetical protein